MTPAERQLVSELFDRLATLEDAPRDPDAERLIRDGLAQAPNATYALVQTALVQDEALKQANARIQELEAQLGTGNEPPRQGGFLDTMRDSVFGRRGDQRGSVPSVRAGDAPMGSPPGFGGQPTGQPTGAPGYGPQGQMPPQPGRGGSFLGTAAAAAAGVIGGSMLLDGIRSMGGARHGAFGNQASAAEGGSPWGNARGGGSDELARQAGADDVGRSAGGSGGGPFGQRQGLFNDDAGKGGEEGRSENVNLDDNDLDIDDGGDFDSGGFGGDE